jgi:SAM-dependent methyltransferase
VSEALYDTIGKGYAELRRPDPRINGQILKALTGATSIVNVGAGAGSYEPRDRRVVAVERSMEMIRERSADLSAVVQGDATTLPFDDDAFDAALAVLTIHHWPDPKAGLLELQRVARSRVVILTHFINSLDDFWLVHDYVPETIPSDLVRFTSEEEIRELLDVIDIQPVPVPNDCTDGFLACYWARPEAYLDERIRSGMSIFPRLDQDLVQERMNRLAGDLDSGAWDERYGHLRTTPEMDLGYRLVIALA